MVAMMLKIFGFIALGLALAWSALQAINMNGWPVSGPVSERMVREIDLVTRLGVRKINIRSSGGNVELGLDIADIIRSRNIAVNVVDFCASACVNYIFFASERRQISRGGVLLMHGDIESSNRFIAESGLRLGPRAIQAEQRYADILDGNPDGDAIRYLLQKSFNDLEPTGTRSRECSPEEINNGRLLCYSVGVNYSLWVPSSTDLSTLDVKVSRHSPVNFTALDMQNLISCEVEFRRVRHIVYNNQVLRIDPDSCERQNFWRRGVFNSDPNAPPGLAMAWGPHGGRDVENFWLYRTRTGFSLVGASGH
ncbi:MAG: hypothetical protein RIA71_15700 [Oceanicaulis sp.]